MMLCDWQIAGLIRERGMIEPAVLHQVRDLALDAGSTRRIVSYGLSSAGYDVRLGSTFLVPRLQAADPHAEQRYDTIDHDLGAPLWLAAGHYVLGVTVERFAMPSNVVGVAVGKSTYARLGVIVNVTPLEPGWCGFLTLEIHNASQRPVMLWPGEGIAQIMFHHISEPDVSYADRAGKYQNQPAVPVPARV